MLDVPLSRMLGYLLLSGHPEENPALNVWPRYEKGNVLLGAKTRERLRELPLTAKSTIVTE